MRLCRKLFVVLLANNDHGKGTIINALIAQGLASTSPGQKGVRDLNTPFGQRVNAYLFLRSFEEAEKEKYETVKAALDGNDPNWRNRDLILFPSHVNVAETGEMIDAAHSAGFDALCVTVSMRDDSASKKHEDVWKLPWDERWTINNAFRNDDGWREQCSALGHDLWTRISRSLTL